MVGMLKIAVARLSHSFLAPAEATESSERDDSPLPVWLFVVGLVAQYAALIVGATIVSAVACGGDESCSLTDLQLAIITGSATFTSIVVVVVWARGVRRAAERLLLRLRPIDLGWACLGAVACQIGAALTFVALRALSRSAQEQAEKATKEVLDTRGVALGAFIFLAVIVAPISEEILFRGVLQRWLAAKIGPIGAIGIASAVFSAAHFNLYGIPGLFVVGVVLGLIFHRTRRLGANILCHSLFNLAAVFVGLLAT